MSDDTEEERGEGTCRVYMIWRSDCDCGELEDFTDDPNLKECPFCHTDDIHYE
jgi:hypothetical protein